MLMGIIGGEGGVSSAAATFPLDGVANVTNAICVSRALLSAYGGSFYTDAGGGALSDILSQISGAVSDDNFTDAATSTRRPSLTTAGPNSVAMADFDGTSDVLRTTKAMSNYISVSEGVLIWAGIIDAYTLNSATPWANDLIAGDNGGNMGLFGRDNAGGTIYGYNSDGTNDADTTTLATGTAAVLTWRHKTGNIYLGKNNVEGSAVASGNTSGLTGNFCLGGFNSGSLQGSNMKTNALISISVDPGAVTLSAIVADLMAHIGAV